MDLTGFSLAATLAAQAVDAGGLAAPQAEAAVDFSISAMFLRATPVVQAVMVLLVLASFWSWTIIVEKALAFRRIARRNARFEDEFWSGQPVDDIYDRVRESPSSPVERVFVAGMAEWRRSFGPGGGLIPGTQARVERAMGVALSRESDRMNRRLAALASVGSVAPFVGLFGTVWGIKHSFESIALQQNTNLAVVAPGIAEALLATALGLAAAIPAVVAYNRLVADAEGIAAGVGDFIDEFSTLLAREIDRASVGAPATAGAA